MIQGLCIGGPKAGKNWAVLHGTKAVFVAAGAIAIDEEFPLSAELTHHVYDWMPIDCGDSEEPVGFWVYSGLTVRDALAALSRAYEVVGNHLTD